MPSQLRRLPFRLTDEDRARIESLAERCGLSLNEFVRRRALGNLRELPRTVSPDCRRALEIVSNELLALADVAIEVRRTFPGSEALANRLMSAAESGLTQIKLLRDLE